MRTHDEFLAEARRMEAMGALLAEEHRRHGGTASSLRPRVIPTFLAFPTSAPERWVEAELLDGAAEFRLVERTERSSDPTTVFASDSAYDLLVEGDELEQRERLSETLAPMVERVARHEFQEPADSAVLEEVEALIEIGELDPTLRLRTKADIVEFLDGRLELSAFVSSVVERRAHCQQRRETLALHPVEQRMIEEL